MITPATSTGFSLVHVYRLWEQLNKWRTEFDPELASRDFVDLWFVDSDVLSVYINGGTHDYISNWPSLFALGPAELAPMRGTEVSETDKELIDSIASSVSYFLFGRFRDRLTVQGRRFLLTPEHDRELDALTIAVSLEAKGATTDYMSALNAHYLDLAKAHDDFAPANEAIRNIFSLLRKGSPANKVSRTLDLRRGLVESIQDAALFPSSEPGKAFAFLADRELEAARVRDLAEQAFECFMRSLLKAHPAVESVAYIKEAAFKVRAPDRRFRGYIDQIVRLSHDLLGGDQESQLDERKLRDQAKIAAREAADVYALARLVALVERLNESHPQGAKFWRVNLLTGSRMQRTLIEEWRQHNSAATGVRLVHPLSAMAMDGFAKPEEGRRGEDDKALMGAFGAYALRVLEQKHREKIDVEAFFEGLKDLLSSAAVSNAPYRERWMRSLRMKLIGFDSSERTSYIRTLRDVISRDFVLTFAQLNRIPRQQRGTLPTVSLPALQLPVEGQDLSAAQDYVIQLHDQSEDSVSRGRGGQGSWPHSKPAPRIEKILESDPTGYSALLCSGLGYLAQGRDWLPLAEAVANTAVAFTSTDVGGECANDTYLAGNEALYLAAFVSRMKVDGSAAMRERALAWQMRHESLLRRATDILECWGQAELGGLPITKQAPGKADGTTLSELVRMRYNAEQLGAEVFSQLIDRLEVGEPKIAKQTPLETLKAAKRLADRWAKVASSELESQYRVDVTFVGVQLSASIIQAWLCLLVDQPAEPVHPPGSELRRQEAWIKRLTTSPIINQLIEGSMLVRVLVAVFLARTRHAALNKKDLHNAKRHLEHMEFATLDRLRAPLFRRLLSDPTISAVELFHRQSRSGSG